MASLERIKEKIAEIAGRPKNVTIGEIRQIVNQLRLLGYTTDEKRTNETLLLIVGKERFNVSDHHRGNAQLKPYCVKNFLGAMINLGLYED